MLQFAPGWQFEVEQLPDWLLFRLGFVEDRHVTDPFPLAEGVWQILERHQLYRVVFELRELRILHSYLIGQFLILARRIHGKGGTLRMAELSESNQLVLSGCRLEGILPVYENRWDAFAGHNPRVSS